MTYTRRSLLHSISLLAVYTGCFSEAAPSSRSNSPDASSSDSLSQKKRIQIVATTGMVADLVLNIGGNRVEVEQLIRAGIDPHLYRPNADDAKSIRRADLVFFNGFKLEGRMGDVLKFAFKKEKKSKSIAVAEYFEPQLPDEMKSEGAFDPHCWMDVSLWIEASKCVEESLCQFDPESSSYYRENALVYRSKLKSIEETGIKWLESIPAEKRIIVSSHDAFRYFGRRYSMQVEGIQGISTSSEAGLRRLESLVQLLVRNKIPAVFVESSVPEKGVRSLIEGAARKGWDVSLGGTLYTDAMGPPGTPESNYPGMMLHNFKTIAQALGGDTSAL